MENIPSAFSYGSEEVGSMEFPNSQPVSVDPSVHGTPNLIAGVQYTSMGPGVQRDTIYATQGNIALQRANAFDLPHLQLQYHQAMSMPAFPNFPGGTFNQIVSPRPQMTPTNLPAMAGFTDPAQFIPQAVLTQQRSGPLPDKMDTLPSFSSIVSSAATSLSTMNMHPQLMSNNKEAPLTAAHMFAAQSKMPVTTSHSSQPLSDPADSQVQQVFFTCPQPNTQLSLNQQQRQQKPAEFLPRGQSPAVQHDISSSTSSQSAGSQYRPTQACFDSSPDTDAVNSGFFIQSESAVGQVHSVPHKTTVSSLPNSRGTLSFTAAGLVPVNGSAFEQAANSEHSNASSVLQDTSCSNGHDRSPLPTDDETDGEKYSETAMFTESLTPHSSNDTQGKIHLSKHSLKHTIKKCPSRVSRERAAVCKPKSIPDTPSPHTVRFLLLGRFGDQSPWAHQTECNVYDTSDNIDFDDCLNFGNMTELQDDNHNTTGGAKETLQCDGRQHSGLTEDTEARQETPSYRNRVSQNKVGIPSTSETISASQEGSLLSPTGSSGSDGMPDEDAPSADVSAGESADRGKQQESETDEEDNGPVFPGMEKCSSGAINPRAFFQVQPDLEDIPYFDYVDKEAEMKRKMWQAKKEQLEMERMDVHVKIDDSQCITVGDQKRWQCHKCPKNYTTKHNLVTHILDHSGIKPHLCMVCGKYFKQLSHLNTHMLTHDNIKPHVCSLCGKGFTQVSHLKRHQAVHLDNKPYICDICNRGFAYPSELRVHKEKHIPGRDKCVDCGEDFSSPKLLKQHQATHEQREELTCSQCNRMFRYPSQLRDHMVTHSGTRPYICTECGMDFMKDHHLKAHMFTHTGLRPYSCQECGRAFNQKANLQRHMLIHSSERAYKCEQCDKTFTQPQTLKAHMVVHAEKKPFWCSICGKEFGRLHNLQGHMHMHNNSKPYVCFCGSSFTLKGNLNRHKKVKHGLNESTESMEEEAVNFLSLMSERVREERTQDDEDAEQQDAQEMLDSPPLDQSGDLKSHRRERKSTPRKIPRQRKSMDNDDSSSRDQCDEEEELSQYFRPLSGINSQTRPSRRSLKREFSSDEEDDTRALKKRRGHRSVQVEEVKVKEEVADESHSDGEAREEGDDDDWSPGQKRPRLQRGAKLDSIIAKKFQSA
ncbi:uncharacterized protein [Haliotis cracherodii]|uniref:uncharacterized protein n=1 Tax=Haliotis cracherodii TaxID=6455 RepID=UPI0039E78A95